MRRSADTANRAVITGLGIVSPIGIGAEQTWQSLLAGRSGIRTIPELVKSGFPISAGGWISGFDPKEFIQPRKSIKVMAREIQLSLAACAIALRDFPGAVEKPARERLGLVFGADMIQCRPDESLDAYKIAKKSPEFSIGNWVSAAIGGSIFPLWMLMYLPNMSACHMTISQDARGPNNTLSAAEASSLMAISEASRVIERGDADVILSGGTGCQLDPVTLLRSVRLETAAHCEGSPESMCRPFDSHRSGIVHGEGACVLILEEESWARRRGARILARILGYSTSFFPPGKDRSGIQQGIKQAIRNVLNRANLSPRDIGHVNAHGLATKDDDVWEARAIRETLGNVPVFAPKSYFGNLGPGSGAVETAISIMALENSLIPATLNCEHVDPECPINIVSGAPRESRGNTALLLNHSPMGQCVALAIAHE